MKFAIDTLSCNHCVAAVTRALQALDPAAEVRVDLAGRTVEAHGHFGPAEALAALAAADYPARVLDAAA